MKILLLGEYSNVHATLADGLRQLGHEVVVASNGDFWKDYPRDIDLARDTSRRWSGLRLLAKLMRHLPRMRGYDIVQLINPMFLELKAQRILPVYRYLRHHNRRVVLGAFGMDHYWVSTCSAPTPPFKYSDFNIGTQQRHNIEAETERHDWIGTPKERLNKLIAADADAIVAGLYEYHRCYQPAFPEKTTYIPLPIKRETSREEREESNTSTDCKACPRQTRISALPKASPLHIFIGIQRTRHAYKGTDVMEHVAVQLLQEHPTLFRLVKAENVPFAEYQRLMDGCDILLDQLYSYSPSMNTLLAMQKGLVCVGGGEEEIYDLLGEPALRPVVNVEPTADSVRQALLHLITHPDEVQRRKAESIAFVAKHHDHLRVAQQYAELYQKLLIDN